MSCSIQYVVKLSAMLPLLLGVTIFNPAKASALDVSQIPLLGPALQRGLSLEPSLRLVEQDMNRNNLQVCVLSCAPMPNAAIPTPAAPQLNHSLPGSGVGMLGNVLPQQVMQLPNQVLQPNSVIQRSQPLPAMPMPQTLPQGLPQSNQIQSRTTLQQAGQALQPQIMQAIGQ